MVYEPLTDDHAVEGSRLAFGSAYRTQLDLKTAGVIVALDADLLGSHPAALRYARDFSQGRAVVDGRMNRLYAVESSYSITGASADHRLPLRSGDVAAFLGRLVQLVTSLLESPQKLPAATSQRDKFLAAMAGDLVAHQGASIVAAGPQQPAEVHAAVHRLNALLGNVGKTVWYTQEESAADTGQVASLRALVGDMQSGKVDTLLILGGNPVYDAPADLDFAAALQQVKTSIHLGIYRNETARICRWHVPQAHFLESWGDVRSFDGTYSVVQPMIAPLYGGRTSSELVARVVGDSLTKPEELVRETFQSLVGTSTARICGGSTVHDGLLQTVPGRWRRCRSREKCRYRPAGDRAV